MNLGAVPIRRVHWHRAVRIIRSLHPPIDLFEDIADPADWGAVIAAEQKTNPRLVDAAGDIDLVQADRRVGGEGASYLMAPFTHVSADRASRFSDGTFGTLYAGDTFEVALAETIHHHRCFMSATAEAPGWTSQFREIVLNVEADLHSVDAGALPELLAPDDYGPSQAFAAVARAGGSDGLHYPSVRQPAGYCVALFYPDCASRQTQGRHLDYHWDGAAVDFVRDAGTGRLFRVA